MGKSHAGIKNGYVFDLDKEGQDYLKSINGLTYGYYISNLYTSISDADIEVRFNLHDEGKFNQTEIKRVVENFAEKEKLNIKFANICLMGEEFQIATRKEILAQPYARTLLEDLVKLLDGTAPPAPKIEMGRFVL